MAINLAEKYHSYVDEILTQESKRNLIATNNDFTFEGAGTVRIYKIGVTAMNDYGRSGVQGDNWSRYGAVDSLNAEAFAYNLKKDRSFTFVLDLLDMDETARALQSASALARQVREVVIPEIDTYVYNEMAKNAGHKIKMLKSELNTDSIYEAIVEASAALDDACVPETERVLIVTTQTYKNKKKDKEIIMSKYVNA